MTDSLLSCAIPVLLTVRSVQTSAEGEKETVEFVTDGTMRRCGSGWVIRYEESELTGLEGVWTTVTAEDGKITVDRSGSFESHMIFEKNQKHLSLYETPVGVLSIGTIALGMEHSIDDGGGKIAIEYRLEIENAFASRSSIELTVKRMNEPKGGDNQ
ncbi:MAG: DUF1934 domain-containing protein [Clostridiales bacterium]|nr:DUF1934 domain-containing protein [Clostridiales bacterium]